MSVANWFTCEICGDTGPHGLSGHQCDEEDLLNRVVWLNDEVKRLTDQLRWRKWPDEKPTESDEYLVEQWLEVKWAKDLNCKLCSVIDWHDGKWVKPSGEVMCWLPIPPSDKGEGW